MTTEEEGATLSGDQYSRLEIDASTFDGQHIGTIEAVTFYGPPRSRRGRLANRIRRLFRRPPKLVPYMHTNNLLTRAFMEQLSRGPALDFDADTIKVRLVADGTFTIDDGKEED